MRGAEEAGTPVPPRARNREAVAAANEAHGAKHGGNPDFLVLPGLVADRKARRVVALAEATGVAKQEPVEFFLIGEASSHDYESLAVSFASPGDVHRALVFIGVVPGRPADPSKLRFWPRGERVVMSLRPAGSGDESLVRAEECLLDGRTGKPLPRSGLVFVGSSFVESPEEPGQKRYQADSCGPHSIASTYNEPGTVLDVPRQAVQSEVYRQQTANPDAGFAKGDLLEVVLEPVRTGGPPQVVSLSMEVRAKEGAAGAALPDLDLRLTDDGGHTVAEGSIEKILAHFSSLGEAGRDPFVDIRFDEGVWAGALKSLCGLLATVDTERGVRIEGPGPGDLYYRAFAPSERFRDRQQRVSQPWELKIEGTGVAARATLTQIEQHWREEKAWPDLNPVARDVPTPSALRDLLAKHGPGLRVILAFVPPDLAYGQLMSYLRPVLDSHPTIHVFVE